MRCLLGVIISVALLCTPALAQRPSPDPFRMGMNTDQVRAAAPNLIWVQHDECPGCTSHLSASPYQMLAGMPFAANLTVSPGFGVTRIEFSHDEAHSNKNRCEARALALARDIEPRYGPFYWDIQLTATGEKVVDISPQSKVMLSSWPGGFAMRTKAKVGPTKESYLAVWADLLDGNCRLTIYTEN